ncbi:hypothetical protein KAH37_09525 [bacterium]|nr:hypothetical protein [bacterium]
MKNQHFVSSTIFVDDLVKSYPESRRFFGQMGLCITAVGAISLEQLLVEMKKDNIPEIINNLNEFIKEIRSKDIR